MTDEDTSQQAEAFVAMSVAGAAVLSATMILLAHELEDTLFNQKLSWVKKNVQTISSEEEADGSEDGPVHVIGEATADTDLEDPLFDVEQPALRLVRHVEVYQRMVKSGEDGDEPADFHYAWGSDTDAPIEREVFMADEASLLGAYEIPSGLLEEQTADTPYEVDRDILDHIPSDVSGRDRAKLTDISRMNKTQKIKGICFPASGNDGDCGAGVETGDVRIWWSYLPEKTVSIYGGLEGGTFKPFKNTGIKLYRLTSGKKSAESMFREEEGPNRLEFWKDRILSFFIMLFGFYAFIINYRSDSFPPNPTYKALGTGFVLTIVLSILLVTFARFGPLGLVQRIAEILTGIFCVYLTIMAIVYYVYYAE